MMIYHMLKLPTTPLKRGLISVLNWLIAEGADVNTTDDGGISPLMFQCRNGVNNHILKALIDAGADVNQKDDQGRTPLMFRAMYPDAGCMETLIQAGADVNATCNRRQTAMMFLTQVSGFLFFLFHTADCVVALLRAGYKVNAMNQELLRIDALTMLLCRPDEGNESVELLLFAAGERVKLRALKAKGRNVPEYLQSQFNLKDMCRRRIREHPLLLDPREHMFNRVPRLDIPTSLHGYLLYDQTLDKKMDYSVGDFPAAAAGNDDDPDNDGYYCSDDYSDSDSIDASNDDDDDDVDDDDDFEDDYSEFWASLA